MSARIQRSALLRSAPGCVWLIALTVAAMLFSKAAFAHEVRPAYLSVQEEAPNELSVLFKTPMQGDARLALTALFSGRIEMVTAGRLASDRRCDGADLAHANSGATGRSDRC